MVSRDLIIVGGGPGGLTAGLYAARAGLNALLLEKISPGGQMLNTHLVENWPGDLEGVSGWDLSQRMKNHAEKFGLTIQNGEVTSLRVERGDKIVVTAEGELRAKAVILSPGASPSKLGIPGEEDLAGKGVSYCGTCDGPFFREQEIVAIGGGDTAAEEAIFLTKFASKVYLVHRRDELRASKYLADRCVSNPKIKMLWSHLPLKINGSGGVESITLRDLKGAKEFDLPVQGVFVFVGTRPNTDFLAGVIDLDNFGFIMTTSNQQTSLPGVYAAGDCCAKILRQIVTASAEGALAAFAAQGYLEELP